MKEKLEKYEWSKTAAKVFARNPNGVCHFRRGGHQKFEDLVFLSIGKINSEMTEMEYHISGPTATVPFHVQLRVFNVGSGIDFEIGHMSNITLEKAAQYAVEALLGFKVTAFRKKGGNNAGEKEVHYLRNATASSAITVANLKDAFDRSLTSEKMVKKVKEFQYGVTRIPKLKKH